MMCINDISLGGSAASEPVEVNRTEMGPVSSPNPVTPENPPPVTLLTLPEEILHKIISKVPYDRDLMPNLRLTCRTLRTLFSDAQHLIRIHKDFVMTEYGALSEMWPVQQVQPDCRYLFGLLDSSKKIDDLVELVEIYARDPSSVDPSENWADTIRIGLHFAMRVSQGWALAGYGDIYLHDNIPVEVHMIIRYACIKLAQAATRMLPAGVVEEIYRCGAEASMRSRRQSDYFDVKIACLIENFLLANGVHQLEGFLMDACFHFLGGEHPHDGVSPPNSCVYRVTAHRWEPLERFVLVSARRAPGTGDLAFATEAEVHPILHGRWSNITTIKVIEELARARNAAKWRAMLDFMLENHYIGYQAYPDDSGERLSDLARRQTEFEDDDDQVEYMDLLHRFDFADVIFSQCLLEGSRLREILSNPDSVFSDKNLKATVLRFSGGITHGEATL